MVNITPIPQGTTSATTQSMVVEISECLCKKVCINNGAQLSGTVSFNAGTPTIVNGTAIVPITATGVIVMTGACGSCSANTRHFSETFEIAFQTTTDNDITLTAGASNVVKFDDVQCCHTNKAKLTTTLTAVIA